MTGPDHAWFVQRSCICHHFTELAYKHTESISGSRVSQSSSSGLTYLCEVFFPENSGHCDVFLKTQLTSPKTLTAPYILLGALSLENVLHEIADILEGKKKKKDFKIKARGKLPLCKTQSGNFQTWQTLFI